LCACSKAIVTEHFALLIQNERKGIDQPHFLKTIG